VYQHGSVRKVPRSQGFAWEFRFYITAPDGKRKLKVQTFDFVRHPTERHVRKAVEGQLSALNAGTLGGKVGATLCTIINRYMAEDLLTLRHSTQTTNKSLIDLHIRPKARPRRFLPSAALRNLMGFRSRALLQRPALRGCLKQRCASNIS
jgi:hypothetical protein